MTKFHKPEDREQRIKELERRVRALEARVIAAGAVVAVSADPTGAVSSTPPGAVSARYNTVNNKLWVLNGGVWRSVTLA